MSRTLAVVLAAGTGSRFSGGTHKLRAVFRGRPVLTWAIEGALGAALDGVIVVTGAADVADLVPPTATVVTNPAFTAGQATSLQAARRYAEAHGYDAMVVGLGDQPLVPVEAWRAVAGADGELCTAVMHGQRTPPVKIARSLWPLLPEAGDEGARVLMRGRPELVREVACMGRAVDIDTVEDLQQWS